MNFKQMFDFLEALNLNNHKDWMDDNRNWYHEIKQDLYDWLLDIDKGLAMVDSNYYPVQSKKAINRINNNLLYHPQKPVYKDHFGMGIDQKPGKSDFYIHFGIHECFLAGGFYKPKKSYLDSIREAIDYNGEDFKTIMNQPKFQAFFGGLMQEEKLKNAPKGFAKDHPHIELLKNKSFAVSKQLNKKNILSSNLTDVIVDTYKVMLPFRNYLNQAVSV
ncbi:MAG: DUF2461 domain-containing protein [Psychroflexus sp.]|nr:DUF2461 domain-containing protein [Psychroflexus sp.]MDR9448376.1 DUF2461 domain-containing protein [Psychroflexus sp.]